MKTKGKAWHLIATVLLIVVFVYTAFFGVYAKYGDTTTTYIKGAKDIRFGVDIKGGVNVTFVPSDGYDATEEQLEAAQLVIENRLVALNVTDYELYVDNNSDSLILESSLTDSVVISTPFIITSPLVGFCRPPAIVKKVLLPDPDGPMIATNSPGRTEKSVFCSATIFWPAW